MGSDEGSPRRGPHPALLLALAIYVALRALLLYTAFDELALPAYELHPMGSFARNLSGPGPASDVPFWLYYDNAAGAELLPYLTAPILMAIGPSYLAVKLVSFLEMVPALLLLWALLRRLHGVRAAAIGALLFALAPTTLVKYTLIVVGNHSENLPCTLLTMWAWFRAHEAGGDRRWLLAAGLAAGLAVLVFLGSLIPLGLLFLTHLGLHGWRRTLRDLVPLGAGFSVGFGTLILFNLSRDWRGLGFLDAKFSGSAGEGFDLGTFLWRLWGFFGRHLRDGATYPSWLGIPGEVAAWLFFGATIAAYLACLPGGLRAAAELARGALGRGVPAPDLGRALLFPLLAYLPLTGLAFALSDLRVGNHGPPVEAAGYRYLLPHYLFAILMIAIVAARLWERRRAAGAALAAAALVPGLFTLARVDLGTDTPNLGARYPGYDMKQEGRSLLNRGGDRLIDYAESFQPVFRPRVYTGLGFYAALREQLTHGITDHDLAALLAPYPAERRDEVARGVGSLIRQRGPAPGRLRPEDEALVAGWIAAGEPHAEAAAEGLGVEQEFVLESRMDALVAKDRALLLGVAAPLREPVARGVGMECGRFLRRGIPTDPPRVAALIAELPEWARAPFFTGLGMGLADGGEAPAIPDAAAALVPEELEPFVRAGFRRRAEELGLAAG